MLAWKNFFPSLQGVPGLKQGQYADVNKYVPVPILPPKNEQVAIANFLDQKTAEIDGFDC
jgi:hypothetical protein